MHIKSRRVGMKLARRRIYCPEYLYRMPIGIIKFVSMHLCSRFGCLSIFLQKCLDNQPMGMNVFDYLPFVYIKMQDYKKEAPKRMSAWPHIYINYATCQDEGRKWMMVKNNDEEIISGLIVTFLISWISRLFWKMLYVLCWN